MEICTSPWQSSHGEVQISMGSTRGMPVFRGKCRFSGIPW